MILALYCIATEFLSLLLLSQSFHHVCVNVILLQLDSVHNISLHSIQLQYCDMIAFP
jgi:hypothetical protein